jgi:hypothetical protein
MRTTWVARRAERLFLLFAGMLAGAHPRTLKRTAHRLQELAERYSDHPDADLFTFMRERTEAVIKTRTGSPGWTVARSRRDGRGRFRVGYRSGHKTTIKGSLQSYLAAHMFGSFYKED